jgi:hypothetical protein
MLDVALKLAGAELRKAIERRVRDQGHHLTGRLATEIDEKIETDGTLTSLVGTMVDYARNVEYGVPADRIPFSPGSGAGRSLYIEALTRYAELRGMTNPRSAAFAIAMKHKREGMPTAASSRFSQDGNRTGFLARAIEESKPDVERVIFESSKYVIRLFMKQMIEKTQVQWESV